MLTELSDIQPRFEYFSAMSSKVVPLKFLLFCISLTKYDNNFCVNDYFLEFVLESSKFC